MRPMSTEEQEQKAIIEMDDPEVVDGGKTYRVTLRWNGFIHNVDTTIPEEKERPSFNRLMESLNTGIDRFHRKIRKHMHSEDKEDEIRQV